MLNTFILIFIMQIPGEPDLYSSQVYLPLEGTNCQNESYIIPAKLSWALQMVASYPEITPEHAKPENIKHLCFDIDHVDPDTQPEEESGI